MRKVTLLFLLVAISGFVFAQKADLLKANRMCSLDKAELKPEFRTKSLTGIEATGDTLWFEDFSNCEIPTGWSVVDNTGNDYNWIVTDQAPGGDYSTNIEPIQSTSGGCFMQLRGDFYNSPISAGLTDMDAYFQTDAIDCSSASCVLLRFESYLRWCCDDNNPYKVHVSTDGVNWTEYNVTGGNSVNQASEDPEFVEVNISAVAANQSVVYLRFHKQGASHYFWMVDDIAIVDGPDDDMVLQQPYANFRFIDGGYYSKTPKEQATVVWFDGATFNNGANAQSNVFLNVDITDQYGTTAWAGSYDTATISSLSYDTLGLDSGFFADPTFSSEYAIAYSISQDETDELTATNFDTINFEISDTVFAHDENYTGRIGPSMYQDGADGDLMGNTYWFEYDDTLSTISVFINDLTTVGSPIIKGEVWKYDSNLGDWILQIDSEEHIIQQEDLGNWVTLPLTSDDGLQQFVTGQAQYAAMVSCTWGNDTLYLGGDYSGGYHNYQAETAYRSGTTWYYIDGIPMVRLNVARTFISCDPLMVTVDGTDIVCLADGGSATANAMGGDGTYTYEWSNGETTATISGVAEGQYTVTVTSCGETAEGSVTIDGPTAAFEASASAQPTACGAATGYASVSGYNGGVPYTYNWTGPNGYTSTEQMIDNLEAGTYSYTITDNFGCALTGTVEVITPNSPEVAIESITNETVTTMDGEVAIAVTGGTSPYTYNWTGPNTYSSTDEDITGLEGGWYNVTVTDDNSCTGTASAYVVGYDPACAGYELTVDAITDVDCYGDLGAVQVTTVGGTSPYTYAWTDGSTDEDLTDVAVGTYTLVATDDAGCITSVMASIAGPTEQIQSLSTVTHPDCHGDATVSIDVTITGGTTPYSYVWDTGETTEDLDNQLAGAHTLTVTDANGCEYVHYESISEPAELVVTVDAEQGPVNGTGGSVDVTVTGGTTPYTFLWDDPNASTTEDLADAGEGTFTLTVTDANGCTATSTAVTLTGLAELTADELIKIYPNPTNGFVKISNAQGANITVFNIIGEVVATQSEASNNVVVDLSDNAEGTYLIKIVTNDYTVTKRVSLVK